MNTLSSKKPTKKTQYLISLLLVFLIAAPSFVAKNYIGYQTVALTLLVAVSIMAMTFEIFPVLLAAILSALILNFFFIAPIYTFHIDNTEDILLFFIYLGVALVNAVLTFRVRKIEKIARDKDEKEYELKLYNTLLNSLSHELRTPISTIIGAVDTLKESGDKLNLKNRTDLLSEIEMASIRLNRQVGHLLNMSRLESGMLRLKLDWCDVNELIFSIVNKLKTVGKSNTITFTENDQLPLYKLDSGILEQVIHNILFNAILYTPSNSTITIEAATVNEQLMISISDDGNGFHENEIPFLFNKFYRSPGTKSGGTGLGLSIAKGFVEAHNGTIIAENNMPHGAKFCINIPAECSFINKLKNE